MNNEQFEKLIESALKRRSEGAYRRDCSQSRAQPRQRPVAAAKAAVLAPANRAARLAVRAGLAAHGGTGLLRCARVLRGHTPGSTAVLTTRQPPLPLSAAAA